MKNILLFCVILLTGCSIIPVKQTFPEADAELLKKCDNLETINSPQVTLSELTKTVVRNYNKYHVCAELVNSWQEWYAKQRKVFQDANK